jgi:hypothetical protein
MAEMAFQNIGQQVMQAGAIQLADRPSGAGGNRVAFSNAFTGYNPAVSQSNGRIFAIHGVEHRRFSDTLRTSHADNGPRRDCLGRAPCKPPNMPCATASGCCSKAACRKSPAPS